MTQQKINMLGEAIRKYGIISPVVNKRCFNECFTEYEGKIVFWYNTPDHSTHMIVKEINN